MLHDTAFESADKRRRLDLGDANVALLRLHAEAKEEVIAAQKAVELQAFFCECCNKGYKSVAEWEVIRRSLHSMRVLCLVLVLCLSY